MVNNLVLCPIHNIKMKKVKIIWGLINAPIEKEEVIYGGCCIPTGEDGKSLYKYGYICPECEKLFDEDEEQNFEYVIKDGKIIPFNDAI